MRKEDAKESDIYILTTQFFSKLEDEGPESISSWTAKKGIDIFEKKLIFIPVNKDIHWSLFVIVNPGKVMNIIDFYDKQTEAGDESEMDVNDEETDVPFILFLDSLRAHKPSRLRQSLYKWLNFEADRLKKFAKHSPFQKQTMPVCFPNGKFAFMLAPFFQYALALTLSYTSKLLLRIIVGIVVSLCAGLLMPFGTCEITF